MAPLIAYTLPAMQLVCNLVLSDVPVSTDTSPGPTTNQTTPETPSATVPVGYVAFPDLGVAYKIYNPTVLQNWKVARERCLNEGARLAVTDSFVKLETLLSLATTSRNIHVGINSMYDDKEWVSNSDGSTIAKVPWALGYPVNGTAGCVAASFSPRGLTNIPCSTSTYWACEVPISNKYTTQKSMVAEISFN